MTPRQSELLAAIIQEFIETAQAVGSMSLYDKHSLNVSPATIRNEMAILAREGYLSKSHSSAGRIPTTMGMRYFVQELLKDLEDLDIVTKEQVKQDFYRSRFNKDKLVREALQQLSELSLNASIALLGDQIYYAGLSTMLNIPEFRQLDKLQQIMSILENYSALSSVFNQSRANSDVKVLIGEETGLDMFHDYAIVFSELRLHRGQTGFIATIGPNRMNYARVMPAVKFIAQTISDVVKGWE